MDPRPRPRRLARLVAAALLLAGAFVSAPAASAAPAHEGVDCAGCHLVPAADGRDRATVASRRCLDCHAPAADAFHRVGRDDCAACHVFHAPGELRAGGATFAHVFGDDAAAAHCASCHDGRGDLADLSDGHRAAAAVVYHGGRADLARLSPSQGCLLCHDRDDADPVALAAVGDVPRFHADASHPMGRRVRPGRSSGGFRIRASIDPRLALPNDRLACQTCHVITGNAPYRLAAAGRTELCLGCHEREGARREALLARAGTARD